MLETSEPRPIPASRAFRLLWGFDAAVAAVVVYFFLWGVADGSVSSFNITLWLGLLAVVAAVVGGSLALQRAGRTWLANALLLVLALPGLAYTLFVIAVIVFPARWN